MDKNITVVSGTSVGALNAALFVNKTQREAEQLWLNKIGYQEILTPDLNKIAAGKNYISDFASEVANTYMANKNRANLKALEQLSKDDFTDEESDFNEYNELEIDEEEIKTNKSSKKEKVMGRLKSILSSIGVVTFTTGTAAKELGIDIGNALWNFIGTDQACKGMFSRTELESIIKDNISLSKTQTSNVDVYATTIRKRGLLAKGLSLNSDKIIGNRKIPKALESLLSLLPKDYSHTFKLNDQKSMEHIIQVLLASSAIPLAFDTVKISGDAILNGKKIGQDFEYIDGGFELVGGDNVPVKTIANDRDIDTIIVVYLQSLEEMSARVTEKDVKNKKLIEIIPSEPLGNLIEGTLNFNDQKISDLIELGYSDAVRVLGRYYRMRKTQSSYW